MSIRPSLYENFKRRFQANSAETKARIWSYNAGQDKNNLHVNLSQQDPSSSRKNSINLLAKRIPKGNKNTFETISNSHTISLAQFPRGIEIESTST